MRALVLGAEGLLGRTLCQGLPAEGMLLAAGLGRRDCDIVDQDAVRRAIAELRPEVVFNAAALTNLERAEADPDAAFAANALGPEILARACAPSGAKLVHFSTDFVFDGELSRPYDEFDTPRPLGVYARSKLAGERLVAAAGGRSFVVRVAGVYGRGGRNFPCTILGRLRAGERVRADGERRSSPTWSAALVPTLAALARTDAYGLYHATAQGETSWAGFARSIAVALGLPGEAVEEVKLAELPLSAPRPRRAVLDDRMLRLRGLPTVGDWREGLRRYLASEGVELPAPTAR